MNNKGNNNFLKINKELMKISALKGNTDAILMYSSMLDLLQLSKKSGYKDEQGRPYVLYTPQRALTEWGISDYKYKQAKKLLKEVGLINWSAQVSKKAGVSTPIYVTENISNLCDVDTLVFEAPKTSNTDIVATERIEVKENIIEVKETTKIETGVSVDVLEMIKSLQADMKKLQSENEEMKNEVKSLKENNETLSNEVAELKEMQSADIVAPVNEVIEQVISNEVNEPKIKAETKKFNPLDFSNDIFVMQSADIVTNKNVINDNVSNIEVKPTTNNVMAFDDIFGDIVVLNENNEHVETEEINEVLNILEIEPVKEETKVVFGKSLNDLFKTTENAPVDIVAPVNETNDKTIIETVESTKIDVVTNKNSFFNNRTGFGKENILEQWSAPKEKKTRKKKEKVKLSFEDTKKVNQGRPFEYEGKWYNSQGEPFVYEMKSRTLSEIGGVRCC